MRRLSICLAITGLSILPMPSGASNCFDSPAVAVGPVYVDVGLPDYGGGAGVWVYLESNGTAGLQRGGSRTVGPVEMKDGCSGYHPDTLLAGTAT